MAFFPTKKDAESAALPDDTSPFSKQVVDTPGGWLNHGWLDDTLVVGAGLRDEQYDSIHVPVRDALQGHTLCPIPS